MRLGYLFVCALSASSIVLCSYCGLAVSEVSELAPPFFRGEAGTSVAVGSGWIALGAPLTDVGASTNQGCVYIYHVNADGSAVYTNQLIASSGSAHDLFGQVLSAQGDTLVVGVANDDTFGIDAGLVYVFDRDGTNWTESARISSEPQVGALLGCSVFIDDDRLAVGARKYNSRGAVYVYERAESGGWSQIGRIIAEDLYQNDYFGCSVALDGDDLIIGASDRDEQGSKSGTVYIYHYAMDPWPQWQESAHLLASNGSAFDLFGKSVAICGDIAAAGAPGANSVYIFVKDKNGGWSQTTNLIAEVANGMFGESIAMNELVLACGAPNAIVGGEFSAGIISLYSVPSAGSIWQAPHTFNVSQPISNGKFGYSIAVPNISLPDFDALEVNSSSSVVSWASGYTEPCWIVAGSPSCTNAGVQAGSAISYDMDIRHTLSWSSNLLETGWQTIKAYDSPLPQTGEYIDNSKANNRFYKIEVTAP